MSTDVFAAISLSLRAFPRAIPRPAPSLLQESLLEVYQMRKQDRVINSQQQNRPQQGNETPRPEQEQMKGSVKEPSRPPRKPGEKLPLPD